MKKILLFPAVWHDSRARCTWRVDVALITNNNIIRNICVCLWPVSNGGGAQKASADDGNCQRGNRMIYDVCFCGWTEQQTPAPPEDTQCFANAKEVSMSVLPPADLLFFMNVSVFCKWRVCVCSYLYKSSCGDTPWHLCGPRSLTAFDLCVSGLTGGGGAYELYLNQPPGGPRSALSLSTVF